LAFKVVMCNEVSAQDSVALNGGWWAVGSVRWSGAGGIYVCG